MFSKIITGFGVITYSSACDDQPTNKTHPVFFMFIYGKPASRDE